MLSEIGGYHAPITAFRVIPLAPQQVDLLLTPNKRRERCPVQRLEPAFKSARRRSFGARARPLW